MSLSQHQGPKEKVCAVVVAVAKGDLIRIQYLSRAN
jgi:hypothetical protein